MAAGQLGGPLFPTHKVADSRREEAARLDFGKAIEEWNRHQYPKAVAMFRKHVADFPDSPWAAEAELHIGCDANGNRTSLTDPNGNATTFAYDLDNRLIRKTYADGKGLSFRYDALGRRTNRCPPPSRQLSAFWNPPSQIK
jgi:YD repeat-containing protein